jgi:hypothetical protein
VSSTGPGTVTGNRTRSPVTVSITDRTAPEYHDSQRQGQGQPQRQRQLSARGPQRARLRWILGGVGFQPAHGPPAFGETAARHCAHPDSNAGGTMPCTARPPVRDVSCSVELAPTTATASSAEPGAINGNWTRSSVSGHGRGRSSPTTVNQPPGHGPAPIEECFGLGRSLVVDLASKLQQPQGGTRLES